jgi:hypothetical protein
MYYTAHQLLHFSSTPSCREELHWEGGLKILLLSCLQTVGLNRQGKSLELNHSLVSSAALLADCEDMFSIDDTGGIDTLASTS